MHKELKIIINSQTCYLTLILISKNLRSVSIRFSDNFSSLSCFPSNFSFSRHSLLRKLNLKILYSKINNFNNNKIK